MPAHPGGRIEEMCQSVKLSPMVYASGPPTMATSTTSAGRTISKSKWRSTQRRHVPDSGCAVIAQSAPLLGCSPKKEQAIPARIPAPDRHVLTADE